MGSTEHLKTLAYSELWDYLARLEERARDGYATGADYENMRRVRDELERRDNARKR